MNNPATEIEVKIREITKRIVEQFNPERIILFGSMARGSPGPDSDADLMIIASAAGSKRKLASDIELAIADIEIPKDVLVVTPEEVETYKNVVGSIIYPAIREGRILYERAA
jgi:predicted nucleotidyltransferase